MKLTSLLPLTCHAAVAVTLALLTASARADLPKAEAIAAYFRPLPADRAALSPDGAHLAYTGRDHDK